MGGIAAFPVIDIQNNCFRNYNRTNVLCKGLNSIYLPDTLDKIPFWAQINTDFHGFFFTSIILSRLFYRRLFYRDYVIADYVIADYFIATHLSVFIRVLN